MTLWQRLLQGFVNGKPSVALKMMSRELATLCGKKWMAFWFWFWYSFSVFLEVEDSWNVFSSASKARLRVLTAANEHWKRDYRKSLEAFPSIAAKSSNPFGNRMRATENRNKKSNLFLGSVPCEAARVCADMSLCVCRLFKYFTFNERVQGKSKWILIRFNV